MFKLKNIVTASLVAGAMVFAQTTKVEALTTTFDFADYADNVLASEANWRDIGALSGGLLGDGVGGLLTAAVFGSGSNFNDTGDPDAFFDKGNAGLGVCSTSAGCATGGGTGTNTGDDEVSSTGGGESLKLEFTDGLGGSSLAVSLTKVVLTATGSSGHGFAPTGKKIDLTTDTGFFGAVTIGANGELILPGLLTNLLSEFYIFSYLVGDVDNTDFYINTITVAADDPGLTTGVVPLPASFYLFGTGLAGLGFMAHRRRKKTSTRLIAV